MQCVIEKVSIAFGKENPVTGALGAERNALARRIALIREVRGLFMNSPQYRVQWMQDFDLQS
jgi:hypothetical protein